MTAEVATLESNDLPFRPTSAEHVGYEAMGELGDQCGAFYPGIHERCTNDAAYHGRVGGKQVALCEDHAAQFADCACDGEHLDREFHTDDVCTDDVDDLRDDGDDAPDRPDLDFDDYFEPA